MQNLTNYVQFSKSTKIHQNLYFLPQKKQASASRFDSFHVSDLNAKINQHRQFSKSTKLHLNLCFLLQITDNTQHL